MPGYQTAQIVLKNGETLKVYTSKKIKDALAEITANADIYTGARLVQVFEAFYVQGRKDGAQAAFEQLESKLGEARKLVPHGRPGRPRKKARGKR